MGICLALYILEPAPVNTAKHGLELVDSSRLWEPIVYPLLVSTVELGLERIVTS